MSRLCREVYAFKSGTFKKSWAEVPFKFHWHPEKFSQEFDLGPGSNSMFPFKLIRNLQSHTWHNSLQEGKIISMTTVNTNNRLTECSYDINTQ